MKKDKIKEMREHQKAAKLAFYRQKEAEKQKELEEKRIEEEKKKELEELAQQRARIMENLKLTSKPEKKKHSAAKAGGLKSTFALGENKVLMTSFGKGNEAIPEKLIVDGVVTDYEKNLEVEPLKKDFKVQGRLFNSPVVASDPYRREKVGKDVIDRKDFLENYYFGRTFEDNIHIQLIYNIMDIEKILSIHINNILYGLNNILNRDKDNPSDIVGMMRAKSYDNFKDKKENEKKYNQFKTLLQTPQLSYYGTAFYKTGFDIKAKKERVLKRDEKDIYYILSLLSTVRQFLAHKSDDNRNDKHDNYQVALYTFDREFDDLYTNDNTQFRKDARKVLDGLYDSRVISLNESFLEHAKIDLTILFKAYGIENMEDKMSLARRYYDFVVRKEYKHLGFSLKLLRECIISENQHIADKEYDTMRSRINRLFDFVSYKYYEENQPHAAELVEKLRAHSGQEEKNSIYADASLGLWKNIKSIIDGKILKEMDGDNLAAMKKIDPVIGETSVESLITPLWKPISVDASYFTKIIYLLTLFLDGKEINDLVTTLINKFENIASFNTVLSSATQETPITREYLIFENSKEVSKELRALNSFARMETPDASTNREMFVEAAKILGYDADRKNLEQYFDTLLDKNASKAEKGFRNFIRNNVINSLRFKYLIKYCNVEDVKCFSKNKFLVGFVMKSIPEAQILRYYKSCINEFADKYSESMRSELSDIITNMSFEKLKIKEGKEKLQKQNIIRLYLTVCYLFFKNLVYVNSRYFLAFYCLERDMKLWGYEQPGFSKPFNSYNTLTALFINEGKVRKTAKTRKVADENGIVRYEDVSEKHIPAVYIKTNLENSDNVVIHAFRNSAEHMNAVRSCSKYLGGISSAESYFEIYHYITQCYLRESLANNGDIKNPKIAEYFENVEKYHKYSKDFVKALCIPFGYNLARFKNLSIDGLFDMNDTRENSRTDFDD